MSRTPMIGQQLFPLLKEHFGLPDNIRKCVLTIELDCIVTAEVELILDVEESKDFDPGTYELCQTLTKTRSE